MLLCDDGVHLLSRRRLVRRAHDQGGRSWRRWRRSRYRDDVGRAHGSKAAVAAPASSTIRTSLTRGAEFKFLLTIATISRFRREGVLRVRLGIDEHWIPHWHVVFLCHCPNPTTRIRRFGGIRIWAWCTPRLCDSVARRVHDHAIISAKAIDGLPKAARRDARLTSVVVEILGTVRFVEIDFRRRRAVISEETPPRHCRRRRINGIMYLPHSFFCISRYLFFRKRRLLLRCCCRCHHRRRRRHRQHRRAAPPRRLHHQDTVTQE